MTTPTTALNNSELAALRMADVITFHVYQGRGFIRAHLNALHEIYTAREQHVFATVNIDGGRYREIACEFRAKGFGGDGERCWSYELDHAPKLSAFASVSGTDYGDNAWPTTAQALRVGDRLCLSWIADNNNAVVKDAGLHRDQLTLRVARGDAAKPRSLAFLIAVATSLDNSARMVKRAGWPHA